MSKLVEPEEGGHCSILCVGSPSEAGTCCWPLQLKGAQSCGTKPSPLGADIVSGWIVSEVSCWTSTGVGELVWGEKAHTGLGAEL